jgi:hypothetical protein
LSPIGENSTIYNPLAWLPFCSHRIKLNIAVAHQ